MDKVDYMPYEEWWQEESNCKEFCMNLSYLVHTFDENLSKFPNPKPITRKEWMETFLLWLEYKNND